MFYDIFISLCAEKGKKPSDVSRDLGIRKSTISMWKKQKSIPNAVTLMQLAEYFNVAPAYLAGNPMAKEPLAGDKKEQKNKPTTDESDELTELLQEPVVREILDTLNKLSPNGQKLALAQLQALAGFEEEKDN